MDKLSALVGRLSFSARVFFNGSFCDANHFSNEPELGHLHLVRSGPVLFTAPDGVSFRVDEPSMVFYPGGAAHTLSVPEGSDALLLCARIAFQDGARNLLARALPDCLCLPLRGLGTMRQTLYLLFAEASAQPQGRDVVLDRLCDVVMIQLLRHQFDSGALPPGTLAGLADRQLAPLLSALHDRPHEAWPLQAMSEIACMSRARFTEHFRNVVGMTPGEYLTRWRVTLAQSLLLRGQSVKSVSAQAGYASPAAFTRAFTAVAGASPRQWLRGPGNGAAPAA